MARTSMAWLVSYVREQIHDSDSSVWTDDDQIQKVMDRHRTHIRRELLHQDVDEKIYLSRFGMLEGTYIDSDQVGAAWDNDNTIIKLWDSDGSSATAITPTGWNLVDGSFWWATDQDDSYFLDGKTYNVHGAIADLFDQLAADRSKAHSWSRGAIIHTVSSFLELARYHRNLAGPRGTLVKRTYRS